MKSKTVFTKISGYALAALSVVFFMNPTVRLVDILPDFIACFIIAKLLRYPSDRVPYFAEARTWIIRIGIISLTKIPAFYILTMVRSGNVADYDVSALMTFSYAVIEAIAFTLAIKNLFSALWYLGERAEFNSAIEPFKLSKNEKSLKVMTPEALYKLTLIFTYFKLATGSLPEMMLLTRTVDDGAYGSRFTIYALYPYAIILCVIATFIFGVIFCRRFCSYIRAMKNEGGFIKSVDSLVPEESIPDLLKKIKVNSLNMSSWLLPLAAVFCLVLRFDNLKNINLVPSFVFGAIMLWFVLRTSNQDAKHRQIYLIGWMLVLCSAIAQIIESSFLDKFGFDQLVGKGNARGEYIPVIISSAVCFIIFVAFSVTLSVFIRDLLRSLMPQGDIDRDKKPLRISLIWLFSAIFCMGSRLLEVIFRYYPDMLVITKDFEIIGSVTAGMVPWFGTLVFALGLLFVGVSFYVGSVIRDESKSII